MLLPDADHFLSCLLVREHAESMAFLTLQLALVKISAQVLDLKVLSPLHVKLRFIENQASISLIFLVLDDYCGLLLLHRLHHILDGRLELVGSDSCLGVCLAGQLWLLD